jgi:hypothetical protein
METRRWNKFNLIEGGRDEFEGTNEFMKRIAEIKKEVTAEFFLTIAHEGNWLRRLVIKIKIENEIRKRINILSSLKNLHAISAD